jgi:hypothetical protein
VAAKTYKLRSYANNTPGMKRNETKLVTSKPEKTEGDYRKSVFEQSYENGGIL